MQLMLRLDPVAKLLRQLAHSSSRKLWSWFPADRPHCNKARRFGTSAERIGSRDEVLLWRCLPGGYPIPPPLCRLRNPRCFVLWGLGKTGGAGQGWVGEEVAVLILEHSSIL